MKTNNLNARDSLYNSDLKHISKNLAGFIKNKKQESLIAKRNNSNQTSDRIK